MENVGTRIRKLRRKLGLSQEEFCNDQSQLSVRQLIRIESGKSLPSLTRLKYIAERLAISISQLVEENDMILPSRYQELKYLIMRTPTYREKEQVIQLNQYFDEIYRDFFAKLPEDEKVAIEILQASFDIHLDASIDFGGELVKESFEQVILKSQYDINDLLTIRLYFFYVYFSFPNQNSNDLVTVKRLCSILKKQMKQTHPSDLFLLRDVLLQASSILLRFKVYGDVPPLLNQVREIMQITQDYQKQPIIDMLEWKLLLKDHNNLPAAEVKYNDAILFSKMVGNSFLEEQLNKEWERDALN